MHAHTHCIPSFTTSEAVPFCSIMPCTTATMFQTMSGRRVMGCSSCVSPWHAAKSPAAIEWTAVEATEHSSSVDLNGCPGEEASFERQQRYMFVPNLSPAEHPPPCPPMAAPEPPVSVFQPCAAGQTRESNTRESDPLDGASTPTVASVDKQLETKDFSTATNSSPGGAVLRGGSRLDGDRPAASATGGVDRALSPDGYLCGDGYGVDEIRPAPPLYRMTARRHDGEMLLASGVPPSLLPGAANDLDGPASARIGTPRGTAMSSDSTATAPPKCHEGAAVTVSLPAPPADGQPRTRPYLLPMTGVSFSRGLRWWQRSGGFLVDDWSAYATDGMNAPDDLEEVGSEAEEDDDDEDGDSEEGEGANEKEGGEHEGGDKGPHVEGEKRGTGLRAALCVSGVLVAGVGIGIAVWARRRR